MTMQQKTRRPLQLEITEQTRQSVAAWIDNARLASNQYLFPSGAAKSPHLSTRQFTHIITARVESIGLDSAAYNTPHYATNEGDTDLPPHQEPSCRSTPSKPH